MGGSRGGPDPPGIARLLIFAMLKFSVRPLLGNWSPPEKIFWIRARYCYITFGRKGARWCSGRASDSESRGPGFDPHKRHRVDWDVSFNTNKQSFEHEIPLDNIVINLGDLITEESKKHFYEIIINSQQHQ